jgi:hypothetical protein
LTAGHLAGTGTKVQVTLLAERLASGNPTPRSARVLWQSDDLNLDFALLQIDETDELYAVRWAELPSSTDLQVEAFGFPDAEFFYAPGAPTTRTYDTRKIAGKVFGGANLIAITQGTGSAIVQVSSPAPSNPSAWQGISGAAVFEKAGPLVGVIVAHGDTVNILRMLPIARLFGQ